MLTQIHSIEYINTKVPKSDNGHQVIRVDNCSYPFEHVWMSGEKLHQFIAGAQMHFLLPKFHQFVLADSTTRVTINLG
jgi:hypothetical protein